MQNNITNFAPISVNNLDDITGGYHDPSGTSSPTHPDAPDDQRQCTAPSHDIGKLLGDLLAKGFDFPVPGRK